MAGYRGEPMNDAIQPVLTELIWVLGAFPLALLAGLFGLLRMASERPLPPLLHGLGPALFVLATVLGGLAGLQNTELVTGAQAASLLRLVGLFGLLPLLGLLGLGQSTVALLTGGLHRTRLALLALLSLVPATLTLIGGLAVEDPVLASFRAVLMAGSALVVAPALGSRQAGPCLSAAVGHSLLVGLVEGASRGLVGFLALSTATGQLPPEKRAAGIEAMLATVQAEALWTHAAMGAGALVPLVALGLLWREGQGSRAEALSAGLCLLAPAAMLLGLPGPGELVAAALTAP